MPSLDTDIHLMMLRQAANQQKEGDVYGVHWGDPEKQRGLSFVKEFYLQYHIDRLTNVVEIGPGGGRWTRYMLNCNHIYAVDYHQELLDELKKNYDSKNMIFVKNNGTDFPNIPDAEIDFIFSFGVFVHMDIDIIDAYLGNMKRLLKPTSNVVIQYSDKTKRAAQRIEAFSDNTPERMLALISQHGYVVQDDNRWALPTSAIVRFTLPTG